MDFEGLRTGCKRITRDTGLFKERMALHKRIMSEFDDDDPAETRHNIFETSEACMAIDAAFNEDIALESPGCPWVTSLMKLFGDQNYGPSHPARCATVSMLHARGIGVEPISPDLVILVCLDPEMVIDTTERRRPGYQHEPRIADYVTGKTLKSIIDRWTTSHLESMFKRFSAHLRMHAYGDEASVRIQLFPGEKYIVREFCAKLEEEDIHYSSTLSPCATWLDMKPAVLHLLPKA